MIAHSQASASSPGSPELSPRPCARGMTDAERVASHALSFSGSDSEQSVRSPSHLSAVASPAASPQTGSAPGPPSAKQATLAALGLVPSEVPPEKGGEPGHCSSRADAPAQLSNGWVLQAGADAAETRDLLSAGPAASAARSAQRRAKASLDGDSADSCARGAPADEVRRGSRRRMEPALGG